MAEQASKRNRRADVVSALLASMAVLVMGVYAWIWLDPHVPLNPFPPSGTPVALPTQAPVVRRAVLRPGEPTPTFPATWTPTPTGTPTPTRLPSSTPPPTHTPTPTSTPNPLRKYTIVGMRARRYVGSQVQLHGLFGESPKFKAYLIFYESDGLRISGMMNVPKGEGPFPVIVLCHGYIHPDKYATGNDTWRQADYLADHGYVTIAPDYRSHAASDDAASFFHIGYAQDVLNLIASLNTVDKADPRRVGLWGHSMGGAIALKAGVVSKTVDAVALFGAVHADERVNFEYGMGNGPGAYGVSLMGTPNSGLFSHLLYKRMSPINYLDLSPPLSIHHGTADTVVPYEWSEDLYQAAQEQGLAAELFLYPGAEHTLVGEDWDLAMERTLDFFDRYVKK
jgi:alpha-beta hydrolase superfamily lysophospholipase